MFIKCRQSVSAPLAPSWQGGAPLLPPPNPLAAAAARRAAAAAGVGDALLQRGRLPVLSKVAQRMLFSLPKMRNKALRASET